MSNNSKTVAAESASPVKAGKKMGIVRFLQLYPQKSGIAALFEKQVCVNSNDRNRMESGGRYAFAEKG